MSIEEKYAHAIGEGATDADVIGAAGMARLNEPMGVILARLRVEWDTISKVEMAQAADSLTARALILMNLRSLAPAKQSIFDFALKQSAGKGVTDGASKARAELQALTVKLGGTMSKEYRAQLIQDHSAKCREVSDLAAAHAQRIADLVGCVLDVWLDKLCHRCDGRGFTGGYGTPRIGCKHCRETGSRRHSQLSDRASEHQFGLWLLNVLDSKCNSSMAQVGRKTRQE